VNADHIPDQADYDAAAADPYPSDSAEATAIILDYLAGGTYDLTDQDDLREVSDALHWLTQSISDEYQSTKWPDTPDAWAERITGRRTEAF
jgi:hypothetical protein